MRTLTIGKTRALQQCATAPGAFAILAADHRDAMRAMIDPAQPGAVPASVLTDLKLDIVRHLAADASAVLLDPVYSAPQAVAAGVLPGRQGLLVALEDQGYLGDPHSRETTLLAGWSVEKARRLGASGVKVLLFYHPEASPAAERQERFVQAVVADCQRSELPLFLEPIAYPLQPGMKKESPEFARDRRRVVVESARRLGALGPDVLKVEFPLDARYHPDPAEWADACAELDAAAPTPWVLLSAGEPFEVFCAQLAVACRAGCAGFAVGRSVWGEATRLPAAERARFLATTARQRLVRLGEILPTHVNIWRRHYTTPLPDEHWFRAY
jgi:tagatose-1,6-bisphosphate aldolase